MKRGARRDDLDSARAVIFAVLLALPFWLLVFAAFDALEPSPQFVSTR